MPVGAEICPDGGVHFRVWAPKARRVEVFLPNDGRAVELEAEASGYFSKLVPEAAAGTRYAFRLDRHDPALPDPASRFQPEGPHAPSEVVDPTRFEWTDAA